MIAILMFFAGLSSANALVSAPPLLGLAPSNSRQNVIRAAESYMGAPYRLGGSAKSGIDCSGLVYVAFLQATGIKVPRTVDSLARWVLVIPFSDLSPGDLVFFDLDSTTGAAQAAFSQTSVPQTVSFLAQADHVGIYLGEGLFIHSASSGPKTGVIQSSLKESGWSRRYLFAGRALPASALSGFAFDGGFGVNFAQIDDIEGGLLAFVRGLSAWGEMSFPISRNSLIGLRTGVAWDRALGTIRVPIELDVGQISGFSLFAGPAFTLGSPILGERNYSPAYSLLGTIGLRWSPIIFSSGAERFGSYFEVRYDNYVPLAGQESAAGTDLRACLSFTIGVRLRSIHY